MGCKDDKLNYCSDEINNAVADSVFRRRRDTQSLGEKVFLNFILNENEQIFYIEPMFDLGDYVVSSIVVMCKLKLNRSKEIVKWTFRVINDDNRSYRIGIAKVEIKKNTDQTVSKWLASITLSVKSDLIFEYDNKLKIKKPDTLRVDCFFDFDGSLTPRICDLLTS